MINIRDRNKWDLNYKIKIRLLFTSDINDVSDLILVIRQVNRVDTKYNFDDLTYFINHVLTVNERQLFFTNIIPFMKRISFAIHLYNINLLQSGNNDVIKIDRLVSGALIANGFFCTFLESDTYSNMNFIRLYNRITDEIDDENLSIDDYKIYLGSLANRNINQISQEDSSHVHIEKLNFIFNYFKLLYIDYNNNIAKLQKEEILIYRKYQDINLERLCIGNLNKVTHILFKPGFIEDDRINTIQVDFANKFIGGGILDAGCCQEEIKFLTNIDLMSTLFLVESLKDNESVMVVGANKLFDYKYYGFDLQYDGMNNDKKVNEYITIIDAIKYNSKSDQFTILNIQREVIKAIIGFSGIPQTISTGNWGCGAFNGDTNLKFLIQVLAASINNKDIIFHCDESIYNNSIKNMNINDLYKFIFKLVTK